MKRGRASLASLASEMRALRSPLAGVYLHESRRPDAVFLTQPMGGGAIRHLTWFEAMDEARRMATHLRAVLPEPSQIAIIGKNSAHWILAELAIWMAGHVSVPLFATLTSDSARQVLTHSEAKLVFVGKLDVWDEMKRGVPATLPRIALPLSPDDEAETWASIVATSPRLEGTPDRDPDELVNIIYTSGTTGTPKGVMHSFGSMVAPAQGLAETVGGVGPGDRVLSYLPLSHVFERFCIQIPAMLFGEHIYFSESLSTFVQDLKRARPTLFISVPRLWLKFQHGVFAKLPEKKLARLLSIPIVGYFVRRRVLEGLGMSACRFAGSGSAPIAEELLDWDRDLGLELLEGYGMSENFCYSHISIPGRSRAGYVGEPYPEVRQRINEAGEIEVKSPGDMIGYFKAPELTAEARTADGFLKTGDLGEIDDEGRLKITGRVKDLFKTSKGKYVTPAPIENRLLSAGLLEQVCVNGHGRPQPHAVAVLDEGVRERLDHGEVGREHVTRELEAMLRRVNSALDPHERLEFLAVVGEPWDVESGFLTPTLKVKRAAIESAYGPSAGAWYAQRQPVVWHAS